METQQESWSLIEELGLKESYKLVANQKNKLVFAHTVYYEMDEPDYEQLVTENDDPVDNLFSEIEQRLLIDPLHTNTWTSRNFWASANVGIYYDINKPPVVPDMFLSFDLKKPENWFDKKDKCYFTWLTGKPPELVVEVISNKIGNENEKKMSIYAEMGVKYYVLIDPYFHLYKKRLQVFVLNGNQYDYLTSDYFYMPEVALGIRIWEGLFEQERAPWARWCTKEGEVLYTGAERAAEEKARADQEKVRADKLLKKLLELGLRPDELESL